PPASPPAAWRRSRSARPAPGASSTAAPASPPRRPRPRPRRTRASRSPSSPAGRPSSVPASAGGSSSRPASGAGSRPGAPSTRPTRSTPCCPTCPRGRSARRASSSGSSGRDGPPAARERARARGRRRRRTGPARAARLRLPARARDGRRPLRAPRPRPRRLRLDRARGRRRRLAAARPPPPPAAALALLAALLARAWVAFSTKPLDDYDAWAIWGMKARALTLLGWADPSLFASRVALPAHPDYPLLVPSLEAVAARAMGGFDPRLVHLQFLLLGVAGIAAIHALARERAPRLVVWPLLLALAAAPAFASQLLTAYADVPLALLVAAGTLAAARCLDRPGPRPAATAALLLGAAALTKEEGLLFAAAALLALLLARAPWRRVLALAAGTELLLAPWQAWLFLESPPRDPAQALALQPPGIGTVVVRKLLEDALSVPSWTLLLPLFGA